ncbi:hypothetical protein KBY75_03505 [Cyanobium sp. T1G-Tous]|uniref:hypothetical protein n=1 Tax=Cyanobium sp. T1G-Tous TaxID=2823722 RepID=UPI0020CCCEC7|nr:hypothetical protein [Cyanobium sp. T1G-Tous]MCP9802630.1 hypothetical protein [Cyanobium sp. T1G-Tous]
MALFNILFNNIGGLQAIGSVQRIARGDRGEQQLPWRSRVKQVEQRSVAELLAGDGNPNSRRRLLP